MIVIKIGGESLEVPAQDVQITATNYRFAAAIPSPYSTDIELPKTDRNVRLLGAYGLLSGRTPGAHGVACTVALSETETPTDAAIQVYEVTATAVTVSVFLQSIPYGISSLNINKILTDTEDTIIPWDEYADTAYASATQRGALLLPGHAVDKVGIVVYRGYYGQDLSTPASYSNIPIYRYMCQCHSAISLRGLLSRVSAATGVSIDTNSVPAGAYCIAPKKTVCPQNQYQTIYCSAKDVEDGGLLHMDFGGQHITNDYVNADGGTGTTAITFNRECSVRIGLYGRNGLNDNADAGIAIVKNGVEITGGAGIVLPAGGGMQSFGLYSLGVFQSGDTLALMIKTQHNNARVALCLEITQYEVTASDYGTELQYVMEKIGDNGTHWYGCPTFPMVGGHTNELQVPVMFGKPWRYAYFGYFCNLPDVTVNEVINSVCWLINKRIAVSGSNIAFTDADRAKEITADITAVRGSGDLLGQQSTIGYRDAEAPQRIAIDNEYLPDEVTLHESLFNAPTAQGGGLPAMWRQYEVTEAGDVDFNEIDGIMFCYSATYTYRGATTYKATVPPALGSMGMGNMLHYAEVDADTLDSVEDVDFVYINGRKYMVVQTVTDLGTGITQLLLLQM